MTFECRRTGAAGGSCSTEASFHFFSLVACEVEGWDGRLPSSARIFSPEVVPPSHHLPQTGQSKQPPSVSVQHLPSASLATQEIGPRNSQRHPDPFWSHSSPLVTDPSLLLLTTVQIRR